MEINKTKIDARIDYDQEIEINNFVNNHLETKNEVVYNIILNILPVAAGVVLILVVVFQVIFIAKTVLYFEQKIRIEMFRFEETNLDFQRSNERTNTRNETSFFNLHISSQEFESFEDISLNYSV